MKTAMKKTIICLTVIIVIMLSNTAPLRVFAEDENLVAGMQYTITVSSPIDKAYPNLVVKDQRYALTDGKKAGNEYSDTAYVNFYRGTYYTVEFAFESDVYVNGFNAGFFGNAYGILIPRETYLAVSEDGENWYTCISVRDDSLDALNKKGRYEIAKKTSDGYYKARYVRFTFASDVFTYCDEITVTGVRGGAEAVSHGYDTVEYPNEFTSPELPILQGTRHVVLIYNSRTDENTEEALLPYAAYLDKSMNVVSADMFDSFLFLPHRYSTPDGMTMQEGWADYLETTLGFGDTPRNLAALENAAETIGKALGETPTFNVYLSVPENHGSGDLFGTVDGATVRMNSKENRLKAIGSYLDLVIKRFNECNFKHLRLVGFYWFNETIGFAETPYEFEFVREYNEYVHSKGYASIWIPYYCSPGFNYWAELGFDCAALQSGWAFPREADTETGAQKAGMTDDTMAIAKKYGMGLELEVASQAVNRFADYIESAAKSGCMKTGVSMYYQEAGPGVFYNFCKTNRTLYDMLHAYINATYEQYAPTFEKPGLIIIRKNSKDTTGNLRFTDPDSAKSKIRIASRKDPEHGTLTLDRDGFFVYNPEKDYTGEDSFSFSLTDGLNVTEEFTINITVAENVIRYDGADSILKADKAVVYFKEGATGTDPTGLGDFIEIAFDSESTVISTGTEGNMQVPENGYVIAASGAKANEFKKIAQIGNKIYLDTVTKSLYLINDVPAQTSVPEEPVSDPAPGEPAPSGSNTVLYIALAAAAVFVAAAAAIIIKKSKFFKGEEKK